MALDIIQQESYSGSINIRVHSCDSPFFSPSAPHMATPHLSLHRIGCKHIPSYFAFPIVVNCRRLVELQVTTTGTFTLKIPYLRQATRQSI